MLVSTDTYKHLTYCFRYLAQLELLGQLQFTGQPTHLLTSRLPFQLNSFDTAGHLKTNSEFLAFNWIAGHSTFLLRNKILLLSDFPWSAQQNFPHRLFNCLQTVKIGNCFPALLPTRLRYPTNRINRNTSNIYVWMCGCVNVCRLTARWHERCAEYCFCQFEAVIAYCCRRCYCVSICYCMSLGNLLRLTRTPASAQLDA